MLFMFALVFFVDGLARPCGGFYRCVSVLFRRPPVGSARLLECRSLPVRPPSTSSSPQCFMAISCAPRTADEVPSPRRAGGMSAGRRDVASDVANAGSKNNIRKSVTHRVERMRADIQQSRNRAMPQVPLLFPGSDRVTDTAAPLLYPMFMMPMQTLLHMEKMITHQELLQQGKLVTYSSEMHGRAIFISHPTVLHSCTHCPVMSMTCTTSAQGSGFFSPP